MASECPSTVGDIMSSPAISAPPDASVLEAARLMDTYGVSSVIVVDEERRPTGVFTERELVWVIARLGCDGLDEKIGSHADKNFPLLTPQECIDSAAVLMARFGVKRAPVVDERGVLIGVVSLSDIAKEISGKLEAFRERALEEILMSEKLFARLIRFSSETPRREPQSR